MPKFNNAISLIDFLELENKAEKYIAHCQKLKKHEFKKEKIGKNILLLIGPEGDFSKKEIEKAIQNKYKSINLSNSRLRTETAGIMAVTISNIKQ